MSKNNPTVSIRVSKQARKTLKLRATHKGMTIVEYVDALIKNKQ